MDEFSDAQLCFIYEERSIPCPDCLCIRFNESFIPVLMGARECICEEIDGIYSCRVWEGASKLDDPRR